MYSESAKLALAITYLCAAWFCLQNDIDSEAMGPWGVLANSHSSCWYHKELASLITLPSLLHCHLSALREGH